MRIALLLACLLVVDVRPANACAPAPRPGEEVSIAEEEAIIIWDPATKTEHFIRRAAFRSTGKAFGFLVPTPAVPQLGEVDAYVFRALDERIRPEVKHDTSGFEIEAASLLQACVMLTAKSKSAAPGDVRAVQVLQHARVAGFDATTVAADDPNALAAWLDQHGFAKSPELIEWLAQYVQAKWTITAFVVAKDGDAQGSDVATRAVRMSFTTERPFYPYREPRTTTPVKKDGRVMLMSRQLRVWFVSDARYVATLADGSWPAKVTYAAPLPALPPGLGEHAGDKRFATVFDDESFPRNGIDEVYFARAADQTEVRQPPIIIKEPTTFTIYVDAWLVGALIAFWLYGRYQKRRARQVGRF